MKTAHYYAGRGKKILIIGTNGSILGAPEVEVAGKVEARKLAKQHGAKPWNF